VPNPNPSLLVWRSLHLADTAVCNELNTRLTDQADCSLLEHDLMAWLSATPQRRLRMIDLAMRLRITPGGLTRVVDRLVERGWIRRDTLAQNRREVQVTLTENGLRAINKARQVYANAINDTFTHHLNSQDLEQLRRIASKLLQQLELDQPC
jgi:DNA-binding MarR family transcriptional regulator